MSLKRCTKCGIEKEATAEYFHRQKDCRDGLDTMCRRCKAEYDYKRRSANRERDKERAREYRQANGERNKELCRAYYRANKELCIARVREYQQANKERIAEYRRKRYKANPLIVKTAMYRRRARKRNAEGSHTAADIKAQYEAQKGRCYYSACGYSKLGDTYHVDHVIPLSRGGSNGPENLVIACPTCNQSKSNKLPHEWVQGGRLI